MAVVQLPLATSYGKGRFPSVSMERLVNCYADITPKKAKSPVAVYGAPGLKLWSNIGDGPIRALEQLGNNIFVLSGTELYVVDSHKASTLLGTIAGAGHVSAISNGSAATPEIALNANNDVYVATATTLTKLNLQAAGHPPLSDLAYLNGYAIAVELGAEQFQWSSVDDFSTWSGADFSSSDALGDDLVGVIADHGELVLLGKRSVELWQNTGALSPFSRSWMIERGCASKDSIQKANNSVFWLGDDFHVYELAGTSHRSITPPWVIYAIKDAQSPHSANSFVYSVEGHTCYVLVFTDLTLVYDTSTGLWHQRISENENRWRAQEHVYAFDKPFVGDFENGNVYELDLDTYDENGDHLIRTVDLPPIDSQRGSLAMYELFADFETGVGLSTGQGSAPVAMMSYSDDLGHSWSNELTASMGAIGEYNMRATWNRLGQFTGSRTVRLSVSDPVKFCLSAVYADMEARL